MSTPFTYFKLSNSINPLHGIHCIRFCCDVSFQFTLYKKRQHLPQSFYFISFFVLILEEEATTLIKGQLISPFFLVYSTCGTIWMGKHYPLCLLIEIQDCGTVSAAASAPLSPSVNYYQASQLTAGLQCRLAGWQSNLFSPLIMWSRQYPNAAPEEKLGWLAGRLGDCRGGLLVSPSIGLGFGLVPFVSSPPVYIVYRYILSSSFENTTEVTDGKECSFPP